MRHLTPSLLRSAPPDNDGDDGGDDGGGDSGDGAPPSPTRPIESSSSAGESCECSRPQAGRGEASPSRRAARAAATSHSRDYRRATVFRSLEGGGARRPHREILSHHPSAEQTPL